MNKTLALLAALGVVAFTAPSFAQTSAPAATDTAKPAAAAPATDAAKPAEKKVEKVDCTKAENASKPECAKK